MGAYFALLRSELRVSMRERSVVFFNYLFPLVAKWNCGKTPEFLRPTS